MVELLQPESQPLGWRQYLDARQIIEEVQRRSRTDSQRYEGTLEVADSKRRVSTKRWTFERRGSFGESKSLLRFTEPPEVKGIALLIHNHPDRASDQWMWRPAIERDQRIAWRRRDDDLVRVSDVRMPQGGRCEFRLRAPIAKDAACRWADYLKGCAEVLLAEGVALRGCDLALRGDVPLGSGLSSSAALEVATILALLSAAGTTLPGETIARLGQRAENRYVGTNCGILDQLSSACCREGAASLMDCRATTLTPVPLPPGCSIVIADTGKRRGLVDSAYNERRAQCEHAAHAFGVRALRDVSVETFERRRSELPNLIAQRAAHVIHENQRVLDAVAALRAGDVATFGRLMNHSHDSLRDLYQVSSKELDAVVDIARSVPGVHGARMTGAGFGGCAIALVEDGRVGELTQAIERDYPQRTGRQPKVYPCVASDGASWRWL